MSLVEQYPELTHPNPRLRERAMREVAQAATPQLLAELVGLLGTEDATLRRTATQALGLVEPVAVTPLLAAELGASTSAIVRAGCAQALGALALNYPEEPFSSEGLAALGQALTDGELVVRFAAVGALSTIGAPAFDILVQAASEGEDLAMRMSAISALASVGDGRSEPVLEAIAADEGANPFLRESATSALSRLDQLGRLKR